ncbi:hypothetical protein TCON_2231 [Astathelohania contejeani]|uniref:Uncharacterized protein n=1 Tax=Astathelohania contejeani TaxID=164912 RepID=A0ABQ7HWP9_9MICR|nr:hypothetical protein TCON_2231 [Thelohania contejeani]
MNGEDKTKTQKKGFPYFKVSMIVLIVALIVAGCTKYYFSFYAINKFLYADAFLAWRLLKSDDMMIQSYYRYIKDNTYDPDTDEGKKIKEFVDMAQGKDRMLLDGHPEHFPRPAKYYYTLNFAANKNFLDLRKKFVDEDGVKLNKDHYKGEAQVREKDLKYYDNVKSEAAVKILTDDDNFKKIFDSFKTLIINAIDGKYKIDDDVPNNLVEDSKKLCQDAGHDDIQETDIKNFYINCGRVESSAMELFVYSRLFYLFYFMTLPVEDLVISDEHKNKYKNEGASRMFTVAACWAEIFSKIYKYGPGSISKPEANEGSISLWFRSSWFGIQTIENFKSQEENIKKLKDYISEMEIK